MEPRALIYIKILGERTTTFIYNEICELAKHIEVKILTNQYINRELFPFPLDKIEIVPIHESLTTKRIKHRLQKYNLQLKEGNRAFGRRLEEIIKEFRPNLIHCHFGTHCFHIIDNLSKSSPPVFISFHGYDASRKLTHRVYKKRLQSLFKLEWIHPIFVSQFMKNNTEKAGLKSSNSRILYYGTDISLFQRKSYSTQRDPLTFFQLSRFSDKKGHKYTLEAFAKFMAKNPNGHTKLVFAGDGPLLTEMKQLCQQLDLTPFVEFKGSVTQAQAKELMEQAHVFVHHSVTAENQDMEGIPNAIMEAMAMELPILSTFHSGIPELVQDGTNGYLVEERDVSEYAEKLAKISSWNYKPENRIRIEEKFEKRAHGNQLISYYHQVLS